MRIIDVFRSDPDRIILVIRNLPNENSSGWLLNTGVYIAVHDYFISRHQRKYDNLMCFNSSRFAIQVIKRVYPHAKLIKSYKTHHVLYRYVI